jgi:hypothetical protein
LIEVGAIGVIGDGAEEELLGGRDTTSARACRFPILWVSSAKKFAAPHSKS